MRLKSQKFYTKRNHNKDYLNQQDPKKINQCVKNPTKAPETPKSKEGELKSK